MSDLKQEELRDYCDWCHEFFLLEDLFWIDFSTEDGIMEGHCCNECLIDIEEEGM